MFVVGWHTLTPLHPELSAFQVEQRRFRGMTDAQVLACQDILDFSNLVPRAAAVAAVNHPLTFHPGVLQSRNTAANQARIHETKQATTSQPVYALDGRPGFVVLPAALTVAQQEGCVRRACRKYMCSANRYNDSKSGKSVWCTSLA